MSIQQIGPINVSQQICTCTVFLRKKKKEKKGNHLNKQPASSCVAPQIKKKMLLYYNEHAPFVVDPISTHRLVKLLKQYPKDQVQIRDSIVTVSAVQGSVRMKPHGQLDTYVSRSRDRICAFSFGLINLFLKIEI
jgi:hypothetical protein